MKIIKLVAENFKRLKLVEIEPNGNIVEVTGKNGQGKTSVLDSIWVALAGLEAAPQKPIRTGQDEARITLDLGDMVVTRTFRDGRASTLRVENKEGAKFSSPQSVLDKLLGSLAFDPLAFARMDAKQQFETLRRFVPDYDFAKADAMNAGDFDKRTSVNRRIKDAEAQASATKPNGPVPARVDVTALVAELEAAGVHNTDIEMRKANRATVASKITRIAESIASRLAKIVELETEITVIAESIGRDEKERVEQQTRLDTAPHLPAPQDTASIRAQIDSATTTNKTVDRHEQHLRHVEEANKLRDESATLTAEIEKRNDAKRAAVAAAKLPVEGLAFGDGFVTMAGEPFSQASDAEQLRASIAMAMAMNPTLRVIRVRDGSLLDENSMKLLADMAAAQDFQVWIELVSSSDKIGFVLEDGYIKPNAAQAEQVR